MASGKHLFICESFVLSCGVRCVVQCVYDVLSCPVQVLVRLSVLSLCVYVVLLVGYLKSFSINSLILAIQSNINSLI